MDISMAEKQPIYTQQRAIGGVKYVEITIWENIIEQSVELRGIRMILNEDGTPLRKSQPDFYRKIADMRRVKSGGKYFKNTEAAREAQKKSAEARRRNKEKLEAQIENDTRSV